MFDCRFEATPLSNDRGAGSKGPMARGSIARVSGLPLAARYLTIVPLGRGPAEIDARALAGAVPWFPVVGLGVGAVAAGAAWGAHRMFPGAVAAVLVVTAWKWLTGGLHLDGLADCLDGLQGRDPAERLRIMSDSRVGAFGAMGLVLFLLLESAAVAGLAGPLRAPALLVVPAIGRATPALLASLLSAARAEGQGARFREAVGGGATALGVAVAAGAAILALGVAGLVAVAAGLLAALAVGAFMARRLGGITGDVLGAGVEASELAALLAVVAWGRP
jgi:adenosylcobinamide-GDP ribazoletransferase